MRQAYYFLVASLPSLHWGQWESGSLEYFLTSCQKELSSPDLAAIKNIDLEGDVVVQNANPILRAWAGLNQKLRNEVAQLRAKKAGKNPADIIRGTLDEGPMIAETVLLASKAQDPLETQKVLDQFRWQWLETWAAGQYFNLEFLLIYALKLKILERYKNISISPKGREVFAEYKNEFSEELAEDIK